MKTVSKFNLASLLLAGAVSLGGIGIAKLITNNAKSASADVTSAYAEEEPTIIGIGEENKATLTLEFDTPVTLTVKEGVTGQYNLALKIADRDPDTYYDFSAYKPVAEGEEPEYLYFAYNTYADAYIATFDVTAGTQLILTSYNEAAVTLDAYFTDLFMGESTDYGIYGLLINKDLSKTVQVENVTANKYIAILQTYDELATGTTFSIQLNSGTETDLVYDANMYGYWAEITVTAETTSFTVRTSSEATVAVDVRFVDIVVVDTALPVNAENEATFNYNEARNFYYDATESGYFTITTNATPDNAEFGITLRTNPNYPVGEIIYDNAYPMHLVAGQRYYFNITYTGVHLPDGTYDPDNPPTPPATANAYFTIGDWTATPIELDKTVYVPVTLASDTTNTKPVTINGIVGNSYNVGLTDMPYYDAVVVMHYGTEEITLNPENGFTGSITMKAGQTTVYFTTTYAEEFTAGVSLVYTPAVYDDEITLGTAKEISLRAGETLIYFIYNLPAGEYQITLRTNNGYINVSDAYDHEFVAFGDNVGYFQFTPYEDEETGTQYLLFQNNGTSNYTFTATVTKAPVEDNTIVLGEAESITLGAGESKDYVIDLTEGLYSITLSESAGTQIEVYLDGQKVDLTDLLPVTISGNHVLTFTNSATAEVTFTVTVSE